MGEVINVDKEKNRAQQRALGDARCDLDRVRLLTFNNDHLLAVTKEGLNPAQGSISYSIGVQFQEQFCVTDLVESFGKIQGYHICLFSLACLTSKVLNERRKLSSFQNIYSHNLQILRRNDIYVKNGKIITKFIKVKHDIVPNSIS